MWIITQVPDFPPPYPLGRIFCGQSPVSAQRSSHQPGASVIANWHARDTASQIVEQYQWIVVPCLGTTRSCARSMTQHDARLWNISRYVTCAQNEFNPLSR